MINRVKNVFDSFLLKKKCVKTSKKLITGEYTGGFTPFDLSFLTDSQKTKILSDADRIIKKEYQIYNFPVYYGLNWEKDPVSGICVKNAPTTALIKTTALVNKADVKNWWEQSHLGCVLTLAEAYFLCAEQSYANECINIIKDFSDKNPVGESVSWKCHMDSSIRLANIVEAMGLIKDSNAFKEAKSFIEKIVIEHVVYISSDYENKGDFPNNHYLSDLVGVIFGCVYLIKNYHNDRITYIFYDALERLKKELSRQVCVDGFDYEFSTFYHCFVTELVCEVMDVLNINGFDVPTELSSVAGKMIGVCRLMGAFNRQLPLIGDQDSSRLFLLTGYFDSDRCDFCALERFCLDEKGADTKSAGIYVLEKGNKRVFFKCGAVGTSGKGTHDHNDQLSVCVFHNNEEIICDSGTYVYTFDTKKRKEFRSVKAHSTVHFGEKEPNDISSMFSVKTQNDGELISFSNEKVEGQFIYSDSTKHVRMVSFEGADIIIKDVASNGISRLIVPVAKDRVDIIGMNEISFLMKTIKVTISASEKITLQKAEISKAYGTKNEATYVDTSVIGEGVYRIKIEERI